MIPRNKTQATTRQEFRPGYSCLYLTYSEDNLARLFEFYKDGEKIKELYAEGCIEAFDAFNKWEKEPKPLTLVEQLSANFSKIIRQWLTPEQLAEVNRRNATPEYAGQCATHDFCDSNQAFIDAWEDLIPGNDMFSDESIYIGTEAWNLSKSKNFQ